MSYYDDIYEIAVDNYYLVTTQDAAREGIPPVELAKLAHRGKLDNIARGLYRLSRYVPDRNDPFAEAVARLGEDAYLCGESVIALLDLAPTNPAYICVATPKRVRRRLPQNIRVTKAEPNDRLTVYEGIPSQSLAAAIRSASTTMMGDRLRDAAEKGRQEGYLLKEEYEELKKEIGWE